MTAQYPSQEDERIMRALIHQVTKAVSEGKSEKDVLTWITRPMWKAFLRSMGEPETRVPIYTMDAKNMTVYGSMTIVVETDEMWSVSIAI